MRYEADTNTLYLSERNLKALLAKLQIPWSARTIVCNDCWSGDEFLADFELKVTAEPDDQHYAARGGPGAAGLMHHETERLMGEVG